MPANLPYPLQFDPSQWKNPYTKWAGQALPFMSAEIGPSGLYGGTAPTDAMGNPIQSYTDANNAAQATYQQQLDAYNQAVAAGASGGSSTPGTTINNTGAAGSAMTPQMAGHSTMPRWVSWRGLPLQESRRKLLMALQAKLSPQRYGDQAQTRAMDTSRCAEYSQISPMNRTAGGPIGAGNNVINTGPGWVR